MSKPIIPGIKWSKYIPHTPFGTQLAFLMLPHLDALFGGAAGGGKSDVLLMGALQYCDVPGFSAIILRRSLTELKQAGALLDRASRWLSHVDGCKYSADEHTWYFDTQYPSGKRGAPAKLQFGYLGDFRVEERYQGAEYAYVGVDEAGHFETDAAPRYLFSRIRKNVCKRHGLKEDPTTGQMVANYIKGCEECEVQSSIPLKFRVACNPGGPGHCVPFGEVLTVNRGWIDIRDVKLNEKVYSVDSEGNIVSKKVKQVHKERFNGELINIETRGMSCTFTPNHKLAYVRESGAFDLRTFAELPGQARLLRTGTRWKGAYPTSVFKVTNVHTRRLRLNQPDELSWSNYCKLLGWFLSEGFVNDRDKEFGIAQSKKSNRLKISKLLTQCSFSFRTAKDSFNVSSTKWYNYFKQFGKCRDKFIPSEVKNLPVKELECLLETLMLGDGCENVYYTTSRQLADDVAEVCLKLGYKVYISQRQRNGRIGLSYQVNISKTKLPVTEVLTGNHIYDVDSVTKRSSDISTYKFKGNVYCIGVEDTHTFFIRQNGSVWVSGNSWIKNRYKINKVVIDQGEQKVIRWIGGDPNKPFIPSSLFDNKFIDQSAYKNSLQELDPVRKEQLLNGDWDASPDSRFRASDARFYEVKGEYYRLNGSVYHISDLRKIFITMDPAATVKEGMIDQATTKNGPSFTVISVWGLTHDYQLLWLYMRRFRQEIPNVVDQLVDIYKLWKPEYVKLESNGIGLGVAQLAAMKGLNVVKNQKAVDKFENATNAIYRMKSHRVWFPSEASWLKEAMDEVFTWTGHPGMTDDIVDTLSDACNDVTWDSQSQDPIFQSGINSMPDNLPLVVTERLGNVFNGLQNSGGYDSTLQSWFESSSDVASTYGEMDFYLGQGNW